MACDAPIELGCLRICAEQHVYVRLRLANGDTILGARVYELLTPSSGICVPTSVGLQIDGDRLHVVLEGDEASFSDEAV